MFTPTSVPAFPGNGVSPNLTKPAIVGQTIIPYKMTMPYVGTMKMRDGNDASLPYDRTFHPYDGISVAGRENPGTKFFRRTMGNKRDMMPAQLGDLSFSENKLSSY